MITPRVDKNESAHHRVQRKGWTTRGSRLEAARRLERTGNASRWVVILASLAILGVSVGLLLPDSGISPKARTLAEYATVLGALAVLLVGIVEQGKSYDLRADRHHRAAMELNELLDTSSAGTSDSPLELATQYHRIVRSFPENHATIDFHKFAIRHPEDFDWAWYDALRVWVWWHMLAVFPWLLFTIFICVIVFVV